MIEHRDVEQAASLGNLARQLDLGRVRLVDRVPQVADLLFQRFRLGLALRQLAGELLDAVIEYMPSPLDMPPTKGLDDRGNPDTRKAGDDQPFAALADPHE